MHKNENFKYLKEMGFNSFPLSDLDLIKLNKIYDRCHDIRKFELDLYWKRSNYFWIIQASTFAGFFVLISVFLKESSAINYSINAIALMGISTAGFISAFAGLRSAKGSKYWQRNWERHIDMIEDYCDGPLYKTIWRENNKPSPSVSGINELLNIYFIINWFSISSAIFIFCIYNINKDLFYLAPIIMFIIAISFSLVMQSAKTSTKGKEIILNEEDENAITIFRRDFPTENNSTLSIMSPRSRLARSNGSDAR